MMNIFNFRGVGALVGMMSGLLYTVSGVFVQLLSGKIDPIFLAWTRSLSIFLLGMVLIGFARIKFWKYDLKSYIYLTLGGIDLALTSIVQYETFQRNYLSNSIAIISTTPLFVVIITCICRIDKIHISDICQIIGCLVGVCICVQPDFLFRRNDVSDDDYIGFLCAFLAAFGWGLDMIIISKVAHVDLISYTTLSYGISAVFGAIAYGIYSVFVTFPIPLSMLGTTEIVYLVMNGLISVCACMLVFCAVKIDMPLMCAIGRTSEIVIGLLFTTLLFNIPLNNLNIIGAISVMLCIIIPSFIKLCMAFKQGNNDI